MQKDSLLIQLSKSSGSGNLHNDFTRVFAIEEPLDSLRDCMKSLPQLLVEAYL